MISITLEMSAVGSLAFAVGVYLPLSSTSPIFLGGMVRWLSDLYVRKKHSGRSLSEDQLIAEGDKSPGVLLASGYIAGGAMAGILIAFMAGVTGAFTERITRWSTANNPFFAGPHSDMLSLSALCVADVAAPPRRPRSDIRAQRIMNFTRHSRLAGLLLAAAALGSLVLGGGLNAVAQSSPRRATTPLALLTYPGFFQGQAVVVRGTLATRDRATLISPSIERAIPLLFTGTSPADGSVELRATFWDVGRLQREDTRLANMGLLQLLPNNGEGPDWPRPGEMVALVVSDAIAVKPDNAAPTVRLVALDPESYVGKRVTLSGQFRGRNLMGDQPQAPNISKWDFVLHNADASVWVTGVRPRGKGFNLDVGARVDTRTWLQVTGVVRATRGLVWLEAAPQMTLSKPDTSFLVESAASAAHGSQPLK
jgi:hypothetical protein